MRSLLKPLAFLPAIFLMYIIYSFSGDTGAKSSEISYKVSAGIVKAVNEVGDLDLSSGEVKSYADKIHGKVRKLAHMSEYAALAIAVSFPLYVYGVRGIFLMILAGGFCVMFAWGDEYHQAFVSGRVSSKKDVLIDSIGAMIGIIFVRIVGWTGRMTIFKPKAGKLTRRQRKKEERLKRRQVRRERRSRAWKSRFSSLRGLIGISDSKQYSRSRLKDGNSKSRSGNGGPKSRSGYRESQLGAKDAVNSDESRDIFSQNKSSQSRYSQNRSNAAVLPGESRDGTSQNRDFQQTLSNENVHKEISFDFDLNSSPIQFTEPDKDDPFGNMEQKIFENMKKELQMKEILDKKL